MAGFSTFHYFIIQVGKQYWKGRVPVEYIIQRDVDGVFCFNSFAMPTGPTGYFILIHLYNLRTIFTII